MTLDNEDAICQIEALERAKAQLLRQLDAANQAQFQAVTTLDNHQGRMQELEHTLATERELHSQLKSAAREGLQWWSHAGAKGSKPVAVGGAPQRRGGGPRLPGELFRRGQGRGRVLRAVLAG